MATQALKYGNANGTSVICQSESVNPVPWVLLIGRAVEGLINSQSLVVWLPTSTEGHVPDASWYPKGNWVRINGKDAAKG